MVNFRSRRTRRPLDFARVGLPAWAPVLARLLDTQRAAAEDRVDYRFENYQEDDDRILIQTHALGFEKELASKIIARGLLVYDGISGATPTGEAPALANGHVPLAEIEDTRKSVSLEVGIRYGNHTTTPQVSYSSESDYISKGISLTQNLDLNQRNTTLALGLAHNFDSVKGGTVADWTRKDTTDVLLGVTQLLGPETVLTANLTLGYADGYLNDPYRSVSFLLQDSPDPIFADPASVNPLAEHRPGHRFKQVGYLSVNQAFPKLHGALEGSYRLHHDDWGIWSHTVGLTWFQKLGERVTLSPLFRYTWQSAADFYAPSFRGVSFDEYAGGTRVAFQNDVFYGFEGDPGFPTPAEEGNFQILNVPKRPNYYSSDYRLSELETFTYGVGLQVKVCEHFTLDLAYKRYVMSGLDGITNDSVYPSANVFTAGCGFLF